MNEERKKQHKGIIILTIIFAIFLGLLFAVYSSNTHLTKSRYDLSFDKLPQAFDGYKILQISDLHTKEFGGANSRLLKLVDKQAPDIVVLTGDIINSTDSPENFSMPYELIKSLADKYDTYYIDGNHETAMNAFNSDYYKQWIALVEKSGAKILDNEKTTIKKGGDSINLFGLWYNGRYYNNMGDKDVEKYYLDVKHVQKLIGKADPNKFNLLLTHNPVYFPVYSDWGADLTLTGHMHGGVIRVPFKGGLVSPERVYWPEYDAGEFNIDNSAMIVNRGLGNGDSGYRIFNWPDISIMTLKSE